MSRAPRVLIQHQYIPPDDDAAADDDDDDDDGDHDVDVVKPIPERELRRRAVNCDHEPGWELLRGPT